MERQNDEAISVADQPREIKAIITRLLRGVNPRDEDSTDTFV